MSSSGSFSGHTKFEMTIHNRSEQISLTIINDTEEQLYVVNQSSMSGATTFYVTDGPDAYRNTTAVRRDTEPETVVSNPPLGLLHS